MISETNLYAPARWGVGLLVAFAVVLLFSGCGQDLGATGPIASSLDSGGGSGGAGSHVSLPDQFSHDYHFRHGISDDCAQCHQTLHTIGGSGFAPPMDVCLACHDSDMNKWAHAYHLGLQQGIVCLNCHGQDAATTLSEGPVCVACHQSGGN